MGYRISFLAIFKIGGLLPLVRRYKKKDRQRGREAQNYTNPVASREHICSYLEQLNAPCSEHDLRLALAVSGPAEEEGFSRRLKAMCRDGELMQNRAGQFALLQQMAMATGRVQAHRDGYGFLLAEDGREDVFLPAKQMRGLFHEDRVLVRVIQKGRKGRSEGVVVEVLERSVESLVGRYMEEQGAGFIEPHHRHITQAIFIPKKAANKAKSGDYVVVEITAQPNPRRQPMGRVLQVLGNQLTPGLEVDLAMQAYQIPQLWPKKALAEAKRFGDQPRAKDCKKRRDLRELAFVTIDGEDARDYDDAVYCQKLSGGGWQLQVAIADVGFYVRPDSALDQAAQERGNSVYFPSCVVPMLPESLSNGLCSLCPQVDRLVMVCEMQLDADAKLQSFKFYDAVIHSHARLTYSQVAKELSTKATTLADALMLPLKDFYQLYKKLAKQRAERGSIEFETTETKVQFTEQGKIAAIVPQQRNVAHRMIEEAMLLANTCAARFIADAKIPGIYRIHEQPEIEKLQDLRKFLHGFSLRLGGGDKPHAKDYAKLLERIAKRDDAHLLQTVLLRSMQRAVYSPEDKGHFALSFPAYTHFTSPIRRYPDLMVHRMIKSILKIKAGSHSYALADIQSLSDHMSMTERRADLATRDALDWLKCHYMQDKVGQTFSGIISDVTSFGLFVELKDIYVNGLIHISHLPGDYYEYDAVAHCLRGRKSKRMFRLGDGIEILVARVDLDQRYIDFELLESKGKK